MNARCPGTSSSRNEKNHFLLAQVLSKFRNDARTNNARAVKVIGVRSGSVVVSLVTLFDNEAPSMEVLEEVLADNDELSVGNETLPLMPNSVSAAGECTQEH